MANQIPVSEVIIEYILYENQTVISFITAILPSFIFFSLDI